METRQDGDASVDADHKSTIADKTSAMRAVMDKEMETLEKWSAREKRKEQTMRDSMQTHHDDVHCR